MKVTSKLSLTLFLIIIVFLSFTSCSGIVIPELQLDLEEDINEIEEIDYVYLDVPYEKYAGTNWCLPASGAMIFKYYGLDITQIEIASKVIEDGNSSIFKFITFAKNLGFNAEYENRTIKEIKDLLKRGIPVIAIQCYSLNISYSHARVIIGYDDENQEIIINDSVIGKDYKISYTNFLALNLNSSPDKCKVIIIFPKEKDEED